MAVAVALAALIPVLAIAVGVSSDDAGDDGLDAVRQCASPLRGAEAQRRCYEEALVAALAPAEDPNPVLAEITELAAHDRDYLADNCHVIMHEVGRRYAAEREVTVRTLAGYLPRSNDPGCPAGFAHGLVMHTAPQIDPRRPAGAVAACDGEETRYRRYSCVHGFGHAFMRYQLGELEPALEMCLELGPNRAADCAQGAYHDYWLAAAGAEGHPEAVGETSPERLCADQPRPLVLSCWYRAFIDTRPSGYRTRSAADLRRICSGTRGLQRRGCVTAASVIGSPDPIEQIRVCASLDGADVTSCLRGVKVQNLLDAPLGDHLAVIGRCARFRGPTRRDCYEWFGRTLAVITDGRFADDGCPRLREPEGRAACRRGAGRIEEALVTFS